MSTHRPLVTASAVVAAVLIGAVIAVQPRVNGELAVELDDGFVAALISFAVGTLALGAALVVWAPGRRGFGRVRAALTDRSMSPWFLAGGLAGAFLVLSQGLTAAALGVALFTVALVGGQSIGSLLIDRVGVGTMAPKPFTAQRVAGAILAIAAVGWAVSDRLHGDVPWWMLVLPFLAGIGTGWQQAVNGQVREHSGSVLTASFISFLGGTVVLAIAAAVHIAAVGAPEPLPTNPWLYTGGLLGVVFIAGSAALVRTTGVLLFGLATIAGQLSSAVLLDLLAPVSDAGVAFSTIGGAALAVVAVCLAAIRPARRPPARPTSPEPDDARPLHEP
jgi:transporter family-2 protein